MSDEDNRDNPYVGLRPFFDEDSFYFFGRNEQVTELLELLHTTRFVPVLGSSGSGKSSLVRAGLIPSLRAGFMVAERDGWRMAKCLPGDAPIENLADGLLRAVKVDRTPELVSALAARIREDFDDAVIEMLQPHLSEHESVLILVDQFEEIFAFRAAAGSESDDEPDAAPDAARTADRLRRRRDSSLLVSVLLALAERKDFPVYVVSTMRTDFLGDCDIFTGLPEAINRSGYLVPRLTRAQLRSAIEGPARLAGAKAAPRLVDRILNDVGDRMDRLPLMQHALRRTFEAWKAAGMMGPIDLADLEAIGGLDGALNLQAEATIADIDAGVAERVFKRLTAVDRNQRRVRHPVRLSDLQGVAGAGNHATLQKLLDRCVSEGTNFMFASADGQPNDPRYNITHESLIRQWDRLRKWVDEEQVQRDWFVELASRAAAFESDKETGLMSRRDLRIAQETMAQRAPTAEWASRYPEAATSFEHAMKYVRISAIHAKTVRRGWIAGVTAIVLLVAAASWKILQSGELAKDALARVDEVARDVVIERLLADDPTYAAVLAGELAAETDNRSTWTPARLSTMAQVLDAQIAVAEYRNVRTYDVNSAGTLLALAFMDGSTELHDIDGDSMPRVVLRPAATDSVLATLFVKGRGVVVAYASGDVRYWKLGSDTTPRAEPRPDKEWHLEHALRLFRVTGDSTHLVAVDEKNELFAWSLDEATPQVRSKEVSRVLVNPALPARIVVLPVDYRTGVTTLDLLSDSRKSIKPLDKRVSFVSFSPREPELMLVGQDLNPVALVRNGAVVERIGKDSAYTGGRFNPEYDEMMLTTSLGFVEVYTRAPGKPRTRTLRYHAHEEDARAEFSRNGEWILSRSGDGSVRWTSLWDTLATTPMLGHHAAVLSARTTAEDRRIITLDTDGMLRVWHVPSVTQAMPYWTKPLWPTWADVARQTDDAVIVLRDLQSDRFMVMVSTLGDSTKPRLIIDSLLKVAPGTTVSPSGRYVFVEASSTKGHRLFDRRTGTSMWIPVSKQPLMQVAFSDDDSLLVLAHDHGPVQFIDPATGKSPRADVKLTDAPADLAIAPGHDVFAIASGYTVTVFRGDSALEVRRARDWGEVRALSFSGNGKWLLTRDEFGGVEVIDMSDLQKSRMLGDEFASATAAAISRQAYLVAVATDDRTIRLHRLGRLLAKPPIVIKGLEGTIVDLAFGGDDKTLIATGGDGDIHIWSLLGDSAVSAPVIVHHSPRVAHQRTLPIARSATSPDGRILTSVVVPEEGFARIGRWDLDVKRLRQRLQQATKACVSLEFRAAMLPNESAKQRERRTEACEARAGRR